MLWEAHSQRKETHEMSVVLNLRGKMKMYSQDGAVVVSVA